MKFLKQLFRAACVLAFLIAFGGLTGLLQADSKTLAPQGSLDCLAPAVIESEATFKACSRAATINYDDKEKLTVGSCLPAMGVNYHLLI